MTQCERLEKERLLLSEVDASVAKHRMKSGSISTISMATAASIVRLWAKKEFASIGMYPTIRVHFSSSAKTVTIASLKESSALVVVPLKLLRRENACKLV
jgi:hypothetical protein